MGCWKQGYYYSRGRYVGNGVTARGVAALDADDRKRTREQRRKARRVRRAEQEASHDARERARQVDQIVSAGLTAAGFWRPGRHAWRRRTKVETLQIEQGQKQIEQGQKQERGVCAAQDELTSLIQFMLLRHLDRIPKTRDQLKASLESLRVELVGPDPSPALRLATESAVWAWAEKRIFDLTIAAMDPLKISPALDRRRNWSQRRFNHALVTVERIRRLTRARGPTVAIQINHNNPGPPLVAGVAPCLANAQ
jgi:hypothetical protein